MKKKERHLIWKAFMALIHYIVKIIACKKSEKGWWLCVLTITVCCIWLKAKDRGVEYKLFFITVQYLRTIWRLYWSWIETELCPNWKRTFTQITLSRHKNIWYLCAISNILQQCVSVPKPAVLTIRDKLCFSKIVFYFVISGFSRYETVSTV